MLNTRRQTPLSLMQKPPPFSLPFDLCWERDVWYRRRVRSGRDGGRLFPPPHDGGGAAAPRPRRHWPLLGRAPRDDEYAACDRRPRRRRSAAGGRGGPVVGEAG